MYKCSDLIAQYPTQLPEDFNTQWVCAYYKNCKQSSLDYYHANKLLTKVYANGLNYSMCSVSRINKF